MPFFSAPSCPEADAALEEIYGIGESRTDADLMNLVIAARRADRIDWLQRMVRRDMTSPCPAHRQRSIFLKPLLTLPEIAGDTDWPSGEPAGVFDNIRRNAWILGQREAFANQWLRAFAAARDAGDRSRILATVQGLLGPPHLGLDTKPV